HRLHRAVAVGGRTRLGLTTAGGESVVLDTAHVIAATGFAPRLARLDLLDARLRSALATVGDADTPELGPGFESSWPGLFFAGLLTAPSFGPSMRFVHGAGFTAGRLVRGVRKRLGARGPLPGPTGGVRPVRAAAGHRETYLR
ncbi:dimethylaniline monooxygenase, partial [Streptomyces sp. RSD-27]